MLTQESAFLSEIWHAPGPFVEEFRIEGRNAEGETVSSDEVYFTKYGFSWKREEGHFTEPIASTREVEVRLTRPPSVGNRIAYRLPGFQCFRQPTAIGVFGTVRLMGELHPDAYDILNGALVVDDPAMGEEGIAELDRRVDRILRILSVGSGRTLVWGARETYVAGEPPVLTLRGAAASSDPVFPLFSHLHWDPILRIAVEKYSLSAEGETGLGTIIPWMLMNPRFTEGAFVSGMTALEHLVKRYRKEKSRSILEKKAFKAEILPRIETAIVEGCKALGDAGKYAKDILLGKARELNRRTLREDMEECLNAMRVPIGDLEVDIPKLIKLRNDLVHGGEAGDSEELQRLERVLRELLSRVVMTVLGYKGGYNSFLDGYKFRQFVPATDAEESR
jgi:hypothetical protein